MDGYETAGIFVAGLLELLDTGQKFLGGILIERVLRTSRRSFAPVWGVTFDGKIGIALLPYFARTPDGRNMTSIFGDRDRLAECFIVTKYWHC